MPSDFRPASASIPCGSASSFAFHTKDLTAFLFSSYIDHDQTRVHIRRTPMLRAQTLAPFLFLDSNNYAFIAEEGASGWSTP